MIDGDKLTDRKYKRLTNLENSKETIVNIDGRTDTIIKIRETVATIRINILSHHANGQAFYKTRK